MYQLGVPQAMRMNQTHRDHLNSSLSMAHDPVLGIVTGDSLKHAMDKDTSSIADNPPVSGAAGASDPAIADAVRGIRDRALAFGSPDRTSATSGRNDEQELDKSKPRNTFLTGMAARSQNRNRRV